MQILLLGSDGVKVKLPQLEISPEPLIDQCIPIDYARLIFLPALGIDLPVILKHTFLPRLAIELEHFCECFFAGFVKVKQGVIGIKEYPAISFHHGQRYPGPMLIFAA